jgi:hypothetical protein
MNIGRTGNDTYSINDLALGSPGILYIVGPWYVPMSGVGGARENLELSLAQGRLDLQGTGEYAMPAGHEGVVAASLTVPGVAYRSQMRSADLGTQQGVRRTTDGGLTWEHRSYTVGGFLAVDPVNADVLYGSFTAVGDPRASGTISRSTDGGATFQSYGSDRSAFTNVIDGLMFGDQARVLSEDGSRFWLATAWISREPPNFWPTVVEHGLLVSTDRGLSWRQIPTPNTTKFVRLAAPRGEQRVVFGVTENGEVWAYREPDPAP